jgi:hypothetical protein
MMFYKMAFKRAYNGQEYDSETVDEFLSQIIDYGSTDSELSYHFCWLLVCNQIYRVSNYSDILF